MEGIQPTMNLGNTTDGWGAGSGIWLFAILALMWGGFGGNRFNGDGSRAATVEDLSNATNFSRLESQVRANENLIQQGFTNVSNGICNLGYQLATDKSELQLQISKSFCDTNANIVAQTQKVLDTLNQNKIEALQARVSQLELQQALAGVVKYPSGYTYNAGSNPFCPNNSSSSGSGSTTTS